MEKALASTRAATKQSALEALLLYVELDKSDPIIEDLIPGLSHKQPKIVAATLAALTAIYHAYGVKIVDPKPVLKVLPKVFGHADKNVRAEASNLAVELYRWLREAMKTLFWNDLKPVQQQELEKAFEAVKQEPPPKQERLLRSQQAAAETATVNDDVDVDDGGDEEDEGAIDTFDLAEPVDVIKKVPNEFQENMSSTKWKDRKDALDALFAAANTPRIQDGQFDDIIAALAKSMKDANVAVVTVAANCIEVLSKGLKRSFAKYRSRVMPPVMERLKEKKQIVADALSAALDGIFLSTGLSECLEDILEYLKHKNPSVKEHTLKFLIRCLRTTREAPSKPETKSIADAGTKLLTESVATVRDGGSEVLGTLMKIMGERQMGPYLEGLDDIRKNKIKEYFDAAEVKAKDKPKPAAPPPKAAPPTQKRAPPTTKKPAGPGLKKPISAAPKPPIEDSPPPSRPPPASTRSIPSKLGGLSKPNAVASSGYGQKPISKLTGPGGAPSKAIPSPRRVISPPSHDPPDDTAIPNSKLGRGLANRPLNKPSSNLASAPESPKPASTLPSISAAEKAELEELRADRDRSQRIIEDLRTEKSRLTTQVYELQNSNAQLIEDNTRDGLCIKAKEAQLVRARADAESAEEKVQKQARELERLRRELSRSIRADDRGLDDVSSGGGGGPYENGGIYQDSRSESNASLGNSRSSHQFDRSQSAYATLDMNSHHHSRQQLGGAAATAGQQQQHQQRSRSYATSPSSEKENNGDVDPTTGKPSKPSYPHHRPPPISSSTGGAGGTTRSSEYDRSGSANGVSDRTPMMGEGGAPSKEHNWKRAAEVTSQLKARIEQMKVRYIVADDAPSRFPQSWDREGGDPKEAKDK